jgi:hypothetical protein
MPNTLIRWPGWGDYPELRHGVVEITVPLPEIGANKVVQITPKAS